MSREIINAARARLTEQAQKEGTELATFIEEHINAKLTTVEAAKKVEGKNLSDLIKEIANTARKKAKLMQLPHLRRMRKTSNACRRK